MGCDGKRKPHMHAARVSFDRRIQKLFNFCECHNGVELLIDLAFRHSKDSTIHIDIVSSGQVRVKTCPDFE